VVEFESDGGLNTAERSKLIRDAMMDIEPGWLRSDLGRALITTADQLDVWRDSLKTNDASIPAKLQVVVVSDLQKGSKLDSLQSYQWPPHVFVKFESVAGSDPSNATVQLLDSTSEEEDPAIRIRVANSEESKLEQFFVNWTGSDEGISNRVATDPVSFYVPAGTSRVMKIAPEQAIFASRFFVTGDSVDFDNTFFTVPVEQQKLNIAYIGEDDPDDPAHCQYYLRRALVGTPARSVNVRQFKLDSNLGLDNPTMVVVAGTPEGAQRRQVNDYLESGGTVVVVLAVDSMVESTSEWTTAELVESEESQAKSRDNYQMLATIDFSSDLFQPFANPRYNDFTKIRFWAHRAVELESDQLKVLARFENNHPAVWVRQTSGGGQVYVFASGWQPSQSQLALSTKFVPLINGLVDIAADSPVFDNALLVGDRIEFPAAVTAGAQLIKPDGSVIPMEAGQSSFEHADIPGIYRLESGIGETTAKNLTGQDAAGPDLDDSLADGVDNGEGVAGENDPGESASTVDVSTPDSNRPLQFAVNVDRAESETVAIPIESIEMFEVNVGEQETATNELAQMRVMRDRDIESRQKVWKWLIVAALILLIGEILLAGKTGSRMIAGESQNSLQRSVGEDPVSERPLSGEPT